MSPQAQPSTGDPGLDEIWPRRFAAADLARWLGSDTDDLLAVLVSNEVARPIWELVDRGGKRWRALVGTLAWRAAGGEGRAPEVVTGIPELLHNASLVIDDIEDGGTERRGGPAAHVAHGVPVALNAANTAYFAALAGLRDRLADGPRLRALDMLAEELLTAHLGQALDLSLGTAAKLGVEVREGHYVALARAKTGALVRIAARLGAICAGASPGVESALAAWAGEVGLAYQIRDDVEDLLGGDDDLEACRLGHPLLLAIERAGRDDEAMLRRQLGGAAGERPESRRLVDRLGALEASRAAAAAAADRACAALATLPDGPGRDGLAALARRLAGG